MKTFGKGQALTCMYVNIYLTFYVGRKKVGSFFATAATFAFTTTRNEQFGRRRHLLKASPSSRSRQSEPFTAPKNVTW